MIVDHRLEERRMAITDPTWDFDASQREPRHVHIRTDSGDIHAIYLWTTPLKR